MACGFPPTSFCPAQPGRFPAILMRTPYGKGHDPHAAITQAFVDHGYAVVMQDVRGRYESGGRLRPAQPGVADGDDTLNWIARQPWSDGKVGMTGGSYLGIAQWKAALLQQSASEGHLPGGFRRRRLSRPVLFHRRRHETGPPPAVDGGESAAPGFLPDFKNFVCTCRCARPTWRPPGRPRRCSSKPVAHPAYDRSGKPSACGSIWTEIRMPVFAVGGWYDNFVGERPGCFRALHKQLGREPDPDRSLAAQHVSASSRTSDFGAEAQVPRARLQMQWFDQWLKGKDTPLMSEAAGADLRDGRQPLARGAASGRRRGRAEKFLSGEPGPRQSLDGDGTLESRPPAARRRTIRLRPATIPCPRAAARSAAIRVFPWGPMDQRPVEKRPDVLVYTTAPLQRDMEVTGPVKVVLYASTQRAGYGLHRQAGGRVSRTATRAI